MSRRAVLTLACIIWHISIAWADQPPDTQTSPVALQELYLEVAINGQSTSLISRFLLRQDHLFATAKDLDELGILAENATPDASAVSQGGLTIGSTSDISLDSLHIGYAYDPARLFVNLRVPDALRRPNRIETHSPPATPSPSTLHGVVLNYDVYTQTSPRLRSTTYAEIRYFSPVGVFSQTALAQVYGDDKRVVRFDTSWTQSRQNTLSTLQLGDTITSSLNWSRSVRLGGVQLRRNFALRPDLITYPVPSFHGSTVVPSSVDLYVNDIRQFSSQVPSGPFVLSQVPGISGSGIATVVTRDALGKSVATSVPLYIDTRLLATGLSNYSVESGFLRRNYGVASFSYQKIPAVSATAALGLNSWLTMNGHAEASSNVGDAGVGGLIALGQAGVLSAALADSMGRFAGQQIDLGYQLVEPRFSVSVETKRTMGNYGDLGSLSGDPVPLVTDRATLSVPVFGRHSATLSYIGYKLSSGPVSRIASLSYLWNASNFVSTNITVYHDFGAQPTSGVFIGLNISFGSNHSGGTGVSVSANAGRQNGVDSYATSATSSPDYAGHFGWGVQTGRAGTVAYEQAQAQVIGNMGEATAVVQSYAGRATTSLDAQGSVVLTNHALLMARRIEDAFAVVSTDGVPGVPVLHENRVIGETNRDGYLLIPGLIAYQHNLVGIDAMKLPADARVSSVSLDLVPNAGTGVLGHFDVARFDAAALILHGSDGQPLPVGTPIRNLDSDQDTIVGYDGAAFVENLHATNHLRVGRGEKSCNVTFGYKRRDDGGLQTLGPFSCVP